MIANFKMKTMKALKYFLLISLLSTLIYSCAKRTYDDTSFIDSATLPGKVSSMFNITQDNSGLVTIIPNGEAVSYYDVYFGDATKDPVRVMPGKTVSHNYDEGSYNVKVVAYNIAGQSTEGSTPLTVSYRQPENVDFTATVDPSNNLKVNVTAKADYETLFNVYFGEGANEVPVSFLEGQTVTHVYQSPGTYTIRIVALSGGVATTTLTKTVTLVDPLLLPVTFESPTLAYTFNNFDGGVVSVVDNPHKTGINTSNKVARMVKNAGQVWGGSWLGLSSPIDFSAGKIFRMKVFSPRSGAKVLLKVENASNAAISFEKEVTTTLANQWEDLAFDYSAINTANQYHHLVLIFDLGTPGDGSANFTYYFDDIRLAATMPTTGPVVLDPPLSFEAASYDITNFDGGNITVVDNPFKTGINTSNKVAQMVKSGGQPWGGGFITLNSVIDFSKGTNMKMKVYAPKAGTKVLLKVENRTDPNKNFEKEMLTTGANVWEELTFDYGAINTANDYQKVILIFDNGTTGDGSANFTYYFDDITVNP